MTWEYGDILRYRNGTTRCMFVCWTDKDHTIFIGLRLSNDFLYGPRSRQYWVLDD